MSCAGPHIRVCLAQDQPVDMAGKVALGAGECLRHQRPALESHVERPITAAKKEKFVVMKRIKRFSGSDNVNHTVAPVRLIPVNVLETNVSRLKPRDRMLQLAAAQIECYSHVFTSKPNPLKRV